MEGQMKERCTIMVLSTVCRRRLLSVLAVLNSWWLRNDPVGRENQAGIFEFGVIGDQEYTAEDESKFPSLITALNDANPAFVVHVGDFQGDYAGYRDGNGLPPCTDETMVHLKRMFQTSKHPFIVTPGDNEWTNCH